MKQRRTLRTLLSFLIAFALILPGAVKVSAANITYPYDSVNTVILGADFSGDSTNDHTYAKAFWTEGDNLYLMIESTHDAQTIRLYKPGVEVVSTSFTAYEPGDTVTVDKLYAPTETQGNKKDAHLSVFRFSLSEVLSKLGLDGGSYQVKVEMRVGLGHWIDGMLDLIIPKASAIISKSWENGPMDPVKMQLYRRYKNPNIPGTFKVGGEFTLTEGVNNLNYTIPNLPYTDNAGRIYEYYVEEVNLGAGYTPTYSAITYAFTGGVHTFTMSVRNVYSPPNRSINVIKSWRDGNTDDRPPSLTYRLKGDDGSEYDYTVNSPNWNHTFNVPNTTLNGTVIKYTLTEDPVPKYATTYDGFTVINTRQEKTSVDVEKLWMDGTDPSGRPTEGVTFNLLANGNPTGKSLVLTAAKLWKDTFKDVERFDTNGIEITYTVSENDVPGYTQVEGTPGLTITNLRTGTVDIPVEKIWKDDNTPEAIAARPPVTINLLADGDEVLDVTLPKDDLWTYTFPNMPKYNDVDGELITYTITEDPVDGYEGDVVGFKVTNTRKAMRDIPVQKIWMDGDDPSARPVTGVTFTLLANGSPVDTKVLTAEKGWSEVFKGQPTFDKDGMTITYTLKEADVAGFRSTPPEGFTITNIREGFITIPVEKIWKDNGVRTITEITVQLLKEVPAPPENDIAIAEAEVTLEPVDTLILNAGNEWASAFEDLPEFDEMGQRIVYVLEEIPVTGYESTKIMNADGSYTFTNLRVGIVSVNGAKTWDDLMNRPESITVNLLQNGLEIDDTLVSEADDGTWTYSFGPLAEFDENGIAYLYTVSEDPVAGFEPTYTGFNILNTQLRGTLRIVKIDDFDFPVEGVIFEIEDEDGVLIDTKTTDEDGVLEVILPLGTYTVREIYAPEDYIMDDEDKTVTLDEDGETVLLTVVNILEIEDVEPLPLPEPKPTPKPTPLPRTGTQSNVIWYGMGILVSLAGFTLLRKKRTSL